MQHPALSQMEHQHQLEIVLLVAWAQSESAAIAKTADELEPDAGKPRSALLNMPLPRFVIVPFRVMMGGAEPVSVLRQRCPK